MQHLIARGERRLQQIINIQQMLLRHFPKVAQLQCKLVQSFQLQEYNARHVLEKYQLNIQRGQLAFSAKEASRVSGSLNKECGLVVKAQLSVQDKKNGKFSSGLEGGIQICNSIEEVEDVTREMIGFAFVNQYTSPEGVEVNAVSITEGIDIEKEMYLSIYLDRKSEKPIIFASNQGDQTYSEIYKTNDYIAKQIDVSKGLTDECLHEIIGYLQLEKVSDEAEEQMKRLYKAFQQVDATQIEIKPFTLDAKNQLWHLSPKVILDDNALFRQKQIIMDQQIEDSSQEPSELMALKLGLQYVDSKGGNIGCLVNGAGLAMSTMDIIHYYGYYIHISIYYIIIILLNYYSYPLLHMHQRITHRGKAANFLNLSKANDVEQVIKGLTILNEHPKVNIILVNIFGGITRCDFIAEGIIQALENVKVQVPLIVRLNGTNADIAMKRLEEYGRQKENFEIATTDDLDQAALMAISQNIKNE